MTNMKKIIKEEVNQAVELYKTELNKQSKERLDSYKNELDLSLEHDILENKDEKIIGLIDKKKKEIEINVKNNNKQDKNEKDSYADAAKKLFDACNAKALAAWNEYIKD